jgi:predicted alpha/beta-hydrolase family hydrolase
MPGSLQVKDLSFDAAKSAGKVSALLLVPSDADRLLVLAHGAGAGMRQRFLESLATTLAEHRIATFRYQFPYIEKGMRRPDPKPVLLATVRAAVEKAAESSRGLPLFAGGKSMGGRMTSNAQAVEPLTGVRGIVFFGFPLHPPGEPSTDRADHLTRVKTPMLFLQGTRDTFADLSLLQPVCENLGRTATLHIIEGADHSFHVPKSSGKTDQEILGNLVATTRAWMDAHSG